MAEITLALGDIRVLDVTVARAGPTCVRQLADWGADVVRVDPPDQANVRPSTGSERHGSDFQNLHRNKRSISLDLKSAEGRDLFLRLVDRADVVVENMRPAVKHRLGIDYDTVRAVNPRIIYGSISGFGQTGPYSERGGVDQIAQGMGGLMSITGAPGEGPMRVGVPIADLAAGLYLAVGILSALHERERSGEGQWVQTSLLESTIAMLDFQATRWTIDGKIPSQEGNHHPTSIPMGCFKTADGYMNIAGPWGRLWEQMCGAIGVPELLDDSRFLSGKLRSEHRDELNTIIAERLKGQTTADWVMILNTAGVPAGPVYSIDEVMADPQVSHLGMVQEVKHAELGTLSLIRNAVSSSRKSDQIRLPSPEVGENTEELLTEIGITKREFQALRNKGVV